MANTEANLIIGDSTLHFPSGNILQGNNPRAFNFPFLFFADTFHYFTFCENNFLNLLKTPFQNIALSNQFFWNAAVNYDLKAAVMLGWQALYPNLNDASVILQIAGTPGNRRVVIQYCNYGKASQSTNGMPCAQYRVTNQVIFYEGSNIIEFHTKAMPGTPLCPSYNAGGPNAVQGLRYVDSNSGNVLKEVYTPGRGINDNWGATGGYNTSRRFTPIPNAPYYQVDTIPYKPWEIIDVVDTNAFYWYNEQGQQVAQGPTLNAVANSTNPAAIGTYFVVKYLGAAGCDTVSNLTDTVWVHFGENDTTINANICTGETYNFLGQALNTAGTYDTVLTNQLGCDSSVTLHLSINPLPVALINGENPAYTCEGKAYIFTTDTTQGYSYQWFKNGSALVGETNDSLIAFDAGNYQLEVTSEKGCKKLSDPIELIVKPNPTVSLTVDENNICAGDTVLLSTVPTDGIRYEWFPKEDFLGDSTAFGADALAIVLQSSALWVNVTDQYGCQGSDTVKVQAVPCCEIYLPNAFTPNGDGKNDFYRPNLGPGRNIVHFKVFNRWGNVVYQCYSNHCDPWNGTDFWGKTLDGGLYFYDLRYKCADGKEYRKSGEITLVR